MNVIITIELTIIIESWSFNVLFLDQIKRKKEKSIKIDLGSFSFIFSFNFHEIENVHEVEQTGCLNSHRYHWILKLLAAA